jgi:putative membrane protein
MYEARRWHPGDWIRLGFLLVFAVLVAAMIYYRFTTPPTVNGMGHYGWWFPLGGIWLFFGFFLFFGLLRRAFWGPRWWGGYHRGWYGYGWPGRENGAYHILRERYARGEITKDQYDEMMRDLYPQPQNPPR